MFSGDEALLRRGSNMRETTVIGAEGVRLTVRVAGPQSGPLLILLHGFPEAGFAWDAQVKALAEAGFCVAAPDQRGYGDSDKPHGRAAYRLDALTADVVAIIDRFGRRRACVVGHDWGGSVAWALAMQHAARVERLAVLNCPHPADMRRQLLRNPKQAARSWYIGFFQVPGLPERWLARDDFRHLARGLAQTARPGTFDRLDLERYRAAWRRPGAMRAMIDWYRALPGQMFAGDLEREIRAPTLLLWGKNDVSLGLELATPSIARVRSGRLEVFEDATHWLHHEEPARVNALLLDHFAPSLRQKEPQPTAAAPH